MYMNQKYKATGFDQIVGGFEKIMQGKLLKKNSVRRHTKFERFWEMGPPETISENNDVTILPKNH